jgi:small ligand-binding sensory domain FIST
MNLLGLLLPDFSARVCGRSIGARLFSCQGRVDFLRVCACSGARTAAAALEYPFVHH